MTRVYIIHPFRGQGLPGEREANKEQIARLCRTIADRGDVPVSPVHALSWLDDTIPEERQRALVLCLDLLMTCSVAEVYGDWEHSEGCQREIFAAMDLGIELRMERLHPAL